MPCAKPAVSEGFADFISYYYTSKKEFQETYPSACVNFINGSQAVLHSPLALVTPLSLSRYTYSAIPKLYSLLDASSMESAGISEALRLPAFSQGGRGVLIGFVDTGIDFTNPLFLGPDQTTRILGIWDQTADGATDSGDLSSSGGLRIQTALPAPETLPATATLRAAARRFLPTERPTPRKKSTRLFQPKIPSWLFLPATKTATEPF